MKTEVTYACLGMSSGRSNKRAKAWDAKRDLLVSTFTMTPEQRRAVFVKLAEEMGCAVLTVQCRANRIRHEMGILPLVRKSKRKKRTNGRFCRLLGAECSGAHTCADKDSTFAASCIHAICSDTGTCGRCVKKEKCGHPKQHRLWECWKRGREMSAVNCIDRVAKADLLS